MKKLTFKILFLFLLLSNNAFCEVGFYDDNPISTSDNDFYSDDITTETSDTFYQEGKKQKYESGSALDLIEQGRLKKEKEEIKLKSAKKHREFEDSCYCSLSVCITLTSMKRQDWLLTLSDKERAAIKKKEAEQETKQRKLCEDWEAKGKPDTNFYENELNSINDAIQQDLKGIRVEIEKRKLRDEDKKRAKLDKLNADKQQKLRDDEHAKNIEKMEANKKHQAFVSRCEKMWLANRNPCSCSNLKELPKELKGAKSCEK